MAIKSYPVPQRRRVPARRSFLEKVKGFARDAIGRITFWRVVKGFVVIFLFVPLVVYVVREVNRDVLIIDPFGVPKSLSEAGLSSDVMANRVGERLREIETATKTSMKKDVLGSQGEEASIPEVEIPGTKLGLKTVVDVARSLFHRDPKHIGGDIVLPLKDTEPSSSDPAVKRPAMISVYFRQGRDGSQTLSGVAERDDVNMLVQRTAELALEQVNPYVLASYWDDHREFEKATRVAQGVAEDTSRDLLHREACFNLWGVALDEEGKYEEAIAKYQKAIELDPKDEYPYTNWGNALYGDENYEEAIAKFQKVIELDPIDSYPYVGWGNALNDEKKYEEAIAKFQKAIELDPKYVNPYIGWGNALYGERRYEEAMAKYQKAVELGPKDALAYNNWGNALYGERRYGEAIAKYQRATQLDPKLELAYRNWGIALQELGKAKEAAAKFHEADRLSGSK